MTTLFISTQPPTSPTTRQLYKDNNIDIENPDIDIENPDIDIENPDIDIANLYIDIQRMPYFSTAKSGLNCYWKFTNIRNVLD